MSAIETTLEKEIEKYQHLIPIGYKIISRISGIVQKFGKSAGLEANWAFESLDDKDNKFILMYCNPCVFTIIDIDVLERIRIVNDKLVTWYLLEVGYIGCHTIINEKNTVVYLHQIISDHVGFGRGNQSIDHLNRNKLDNRISNLKLSYQSEQNQNTGKRSRKSNAKELPKDIKQEDLPKFVVYYKECIDKEKGKYREFFRVEKHPLQKQKYKDELFEDPDNIIVKEWATTKSNKIQIKDKLEQAKEYVTILDNIIGYEASK